MTNLELMRLHAEVLFTHDDRSRLLYVNEPPAAVRPAPRFFLGRTAEGAVWRFRSEPPRDLVERLEALCRNEPTATDLREKPRYYTEYLDLLEADAHIERIWTGPAYSFPDDLARPSTQLVEITSDNASLLQAKLAEWVPDVSYCRPFVAVERGGVAVSLCSSVRISPKAHEAGVETLSSFRNRGYASDAVAGWAQLVRERGCSPLCSTSWENIASQALARRLGLVPYGVDFQVW